ncbi:MAG: hypothetical protein H0U74_03140 [Bradymonadaceae bacterium]|nr:hypothetical protein [Lujinxingiaceae bacterium]
MSDTALPPEASQWLQTLRAFSATHRSAPLSGRDDLDALGDWQRRITGGLIIQFFEFLEKKAVDELAEDSTPIGERVFLLITDEPGAAAAQELMEMDSPLAICLLKEEWRRYVDDEQNNADEDFRLHYQFWSVWHQNVPEQWELELEVDTDYWVHEEGFALADGVGRGAQHLWAWDGEQMKIVEETMTSWVS